MRFIDTTKNNMIEQAAEKAEALLKLYSPMLAEIELKDDFRYDSGYGHKVAAKLFACSDKTIIGQYFPKFKNSNAIGQFNDGQIQFNAYRINTLNFAQAVGLILHEHSHKAGFHHIDAGWWGKIRRNYKTEEKCLYSVPYFISENVERWL